MDKWTDRQTTRYKDGLLNRQKDKQRGINLTDGLTDIKTDKKKYS